MRQGRARHLRNRAQSSALRTALKRVRTATTSEQAGEAYRVAARLLDRAARKNRSITTKRPDNNRDRQPLFESFQNKKRRLAKAARQDVPQERPAAKARKSGTCFRT